MLKKEEKRRWEGKEREVNNAWVPVRKGRWRSCSLHLDCMMTPVYGRNTKYFISRSGL
jgi:hypothetical protein